MKEYQIKFKLRDDEIIKQDEDKYWGIYRYQVYCKDCGWINSRTKKIHRSIIKDAIKCPKCKRQLAMINEKLNYIRGISFYEIINTKTKKGIATRGINDFLKMLNFNK